MDTKKYPIGKFEKPDVISEGLIADWISTIAVFPEKIKGAIENLSEKQLDTSYRKGGWTLRQVVHHCADSHMNAFCRIKLALTENSPTIKSYYEDKWADLPDGKMHVNASLVLLKGLHQRWVVLLSNLSSSDLDRNFKHPEQDREISLSETIGMYAWHCEHHLAHILMGSEDGRK